MSEGVVLNPTRLVLAALIGLVILLLLMVGMCVQERFFCRFFCPMGAVFSLLPVLSVFLPSQNERKLQERM